MKKKLFSFSMTLVTLVLLLAQTTGVVQAAVIYIDDFNTGTTQTLTATNGGGQVTSFAAVGFGGERDFIAEVDSGTGSITVTDSNSNDYLELSSTGTAGGSVEIQYDGADASAVLNQSGLGSRNLVDGTNNSIHMEFYRNDVPLSVMVSIFSNGGLSSSSLFFSVPGGLNGHRDIVIHHSQFTGVNFTDVSAIRLLFTPQATGMFTQFALIDSADKTDRGDLPEPGHSYPVDYGRPGHLPQGVTLGAYVDAEENDNYGFGGHTSDLLGDDFAQYDDEDGVSATGNWFDGQGEATVVVGSPDSLNGCLWAWLDFRGATIGSPDGDFDDANEAIIVGQVVTPGSNLVTFTLPTISSGTYSWFARFRLIPDMGDAGCGDETPPAGEPAVIDNIIGGEVEDYRFNFNPTAITLQAASAAASPFGAPVLALAAGLLLVTGAGALLLLRRRAL